MLSLSKSLPGLCPWFSRVSLVVSLFHRQPAPPPNLGDVLLAAPTTATQQKESQEGHQDDEEDNPHGYTSDGPSAEFGCIWNGMGSCEELECVCVCTMRGGALDNADGVYICKLTPTLSHSLTHSIITLTKKQTHKQTNKLTCNISIIEITHCYIIGTISDGDGGSGFTAGGTVVQPHLLLPADKEVKVVSRDGTHVEDTWRREKNVQGCVVVMMVRDREVLAIRRCMIRGYLSGRVTHKIFYYIDKVQQCTE